MRRRAAVDKRRRNARPSKYRPRTEAQRQRRKDLWEVRAEARKARQAEAEEVRLHARLAELETALRDHGSDGVHRRRHSRSLEDIENDAERLAVLRARVERLEALWAIDKRRRETRGKIIMGGALLAEMIDAVAAGETEVLAGFLDVLDRRVEAPRDRLTLHDLLGGAPLPLRSSDAFAIDPNEAEAPFPAAPEFDALLQSAMAEEAEFTPSEIDPDYADLDAAWSSSR
ncbi:MAG: hypothetical protein JO303_04760 [Caulobacteraceae bacterium]|nr:hypothetical protein [Caulobacteraceae bacterium]